MFDNVEDAIQELKSGKPIIVVDDEDREMKATSSLYLSI